MSSSSFESNLTKVISRINDLASDDSRKLVAIAGPPACGKSTLAEALVEKLNETANPDAPTAALLQMDGYHLDNGLLEKRGLLAKKGAPETFDSWAFCEAVRSLANVKHELYLPKFDRVEDKSIAQAISISPDTPYVIIEGNYLLLDQQPWASVRKLYDLSIFLSERSIVLQERLMQRWLKAGLSLKEASAKTVNNDLPNATTVTELSVSADLFL